MCNMTVNVRITVLLAVAVVMSLAASPANASGGCLGDLGDKDGEVDASDLAILLGSWGTCRIEPCPADLDSSQNVDAADLALLLGNWGPCLFDYNDYEDAEAEEIALETLGPAGPLQPPDEIYSRCDQDLDLIRAAEPALISEIHSIAWSPNTLIVFINKAADQTEYLALNDYYQVTDIHHLLFNIYVLTFPGNLNMPALAQIYDALPAVDLAEINGTGGGQNYWEPTDLGAGTWRWDIDDGWCDCMAGCICHIFYVFETDAKGSVELLSVEELPGCPQSCE